MANQELVPGMEVVTNKGTGTIIQIKHGNLLNQDYRVRLITGKEHWFAEKHITLTEKQLRKTS